MRVLREAFLIVQFVFRSLPAFSFWEAKGFLDKLAHVLNCTFWFADTITLQFFFQSGPVNVPTATDWVYKSCLGAVGVDFGGFRNDAGIEDALASFVAFRVQTNVAGRTRQSLWCLFFFIEASDLAQSLSSSHMPERPVKIANHHLSMVVHIVIVIEEKKWKRDECDESHHDHEVHHQLEVRVDTVA